MEETLPAGSSYQTPLTGQLPPSEQYEPQGPVSLPPSQHQPVETTLPASSCQMPTYRPRLQPVRQSKLHGPLSSGGCAAVQRRANSGNLPASLKLPDAIEIEPLLPLQLRAWVVWEWAPGVHIHSPRRRHETPILRHLHTQWALTLSKGTRLHGKRCIGLIT